jgi:hypothetical protein
MINKPKRNRSFGRIIYKWAPLLYCHTLFVTMEKGPGDEVVRKRAISAEIVGSDPAVSPLPGERKTLQVIV